jgi:putative ABC transport system permease protein
MPHVKSALRFIRKSPGSAIAIILTLAIAIGGDSAVFSAIDAILLRPLPFPNGDRLMTLRQRTKRPVPFVAPVRLQDWDRLNATFQAMTGYYVEDTSETSGIFPEKLTRAVVTPRFLEVWGISPALGRDFVPEEERFGGPDAVIVSDRLWRRRFSADPNAIGKRLRFGQSAYTIVGVMPASFLFPERDVDVWFPAPMDAPYAQSRESTWFIVVGRLKPGVTVDQARANLATVQAQLARQYPKTDADIKVEIEPLKETTVGGVRRSLWILFGSVTLLLLIACTNIAALLLARATQREHEIAVRFSLGASRGSVIAQLLAEVSVLAVLGAGAGLLVAAGAAQAFHALAKDLPRIDEVRLDWRIVLYSLACSVAATFLCGLFPAVRASRRGLASSLAQAGRTQVSARSPLQWLLVGVQVALAVTLLAGAGLLLRSFQALGNVAPGFETAHVLTLHITGGYGETADMKALTQRIDRTLDALRATPGVEAAATSAAAPGVPGEYRMELKFVEGENDPTRQIVGDSRFVSPGYFSTMRIPLLSGEPCRAGLAQPAMIVNRSFQNAYLGGTPALGRHLQGLPASPFLPPAEIRGVVADSREQGINRAPGPTVYWCVSAPDPDPFYLIRTRTEPMAMAEIVRRKIREIEPARSVFDMLPLDARIGEAFAENRLRTVLLTLFALTAVSLASIGLYGTLSYFVNVRRREVGLRLALGALRGQIVTQFLLQGVGITLAGCVAGLALATAFSRALSGMLYGVSASDAATLSGVVLLVLGIATVASLAPAVRAARVEPMHVLRDE